MLEFSDPVFIGTRYIVRDGELWDCNGPGPPFLAPYRPPTDEEICERLAQLPSLRDESRAGQNPQI
jgi:hypothetical protein